MNLCRLFRLLGLSCGVLLAGSSAAHAQFGPIVSVAFGSLDESGGYWRETRHVTLDVFAGIRTKPDNAIGLVVAGFGGATNTLSGGENADCALAPGGGCIPRFPQFRYLGAAVGGEVRSRRVGLVLVGGPGAFSTNSTNVATPGPGGTTVFTTEPSGARFGLLMRGDVTLHLDQYFGVFAAASTRVIPNFGGERLQLRGISFGVRIK